MAEKRKRQQDLAQIVSGNTKSARSGGSTDRKQKAASGAKKSLQSETSVHSKRVVGTAQMELNEGDKDMKQFLDPLINATDSNLNELKDSLKLAPGDDTLNVVGFRLWSALNS